MRQQLKRRARQTHRERERESIYGFYYCARAHHACPHTFPYRLNESQKSKQPKWNNPTVSAQKPEKAEKRAVARREVEVSAEPDQMAESKNKNCRAQSHQPPSISHTLHY